MTEEGNEQGSAYSFQKFSQIKVCDNLRLTLTKTASVIYRLVMCITWRDVTSTRDLAIKSFFSNAPPLTAHISSYRLVTPSVTALKSLININARNR